MAWAKNSILIPVLFAVMIGLTIVNVHATTENFTVPSESEVSRELRLHENDRVSIGFSVIGETTNELNFYVTDPNGNIILYHERVGQTNISFLAETTGPYVLHFDNTLSTESKMVTLNYDIEHLIMGIPQTLFLVIVIAGILILAVASYVMMGKP